MSLKCLAARAVQKHHLPYKGNIPKALEGFVELHGPRIRVPEDNEDLHEDIDIVYGLVSSVA